MRSFLGTLWLTVSFFFMESAFHWHSFCHVHGCVLFHFGHRRLSLSVLVEIADGLIGKVFGFFENLYGFFIGFAQDLVTAVVQTLIFGGQFLL